MSVFPKAFPRRGEVYTVDFGEPRGSAQAGERPALVVSNDVNNNVGSVVIVAAITKTIPAKRYPQNVHLDAGPLPLAGTILCGQLLTIDKVDLLRHRATLPQATMDEVDVALCKALGIRRAPPIPPTPTAPPAN
jgi:mRNA interferase MazF